MRNPMTPLTNKELACLNAWPTGTVGHYHDHELIQAVNLLCQQWGYGRMEQLVSAMEDIWRHPENIAQYEAFREERMKLIDQDKLERLGDDVPQPMIVD